MPSLSPVSPSPDDVVVRPGERVSLVELARASGDDAEPARSPVGASAPVVDDTPFDPADPWDLRHTDATWAALAPRVALLLRGDNGRPPRRPVVVAPRLPERPAVVPGAGSGDVDGGDLVAWLAEQAWSAFAQDLVRQVGRGRPLTARQRAAAVRMRERCAARRGGRG